MNAGTIVTLIIVAAVIGAAIFAMIRQKKKGHGSYGCGDGCSACAAKGKCKSKKE